MTWALTRSASPARWARAITGTSPARDTRFGSSNDACVLARPCNNRTYKVSSPNRVLEALDTPIVPVQRAPFTLTRPETSLIDRWIEA